MNPYHRDIASVVRTSAAMCCACTLAGAAATCDLPGRSDTLELLLSGARVGLFVETFERDSVTGGMVERTLMDAELPQDHGVSGTQRLRAEERREYGPDGVLRRAFQRMATASGDNAWELTAGASGGPVLRRTIGGVTTEEAVRGVPAQHIDNVCRLYRGILDRTIRVGDTWRDTSYDLAFAQPVISRITCRGAPTAANGYTWEFHSTDSASGLEERWVTDTNGTTLYRSVPPFFEGRRPGYAGDMQADPARGAAGSLSALFSVPVAAPPRSGEEIELRLGSGVAMPLSAVGFYRRERGCWVLRPFLSVCPPGLQAAALACASAPDTAPTPTLQSSHPAIVALADSLASAGADACHLAARMCGHVHERIEYRMHAAYSSALETLTAGYGDCGEKAVLLAALLRARGIPGHVVLGLVYVAERRAYMGHAWVGIRTASGWLCADPAMGVFPASAGLVPLLVDDTGTAGRGLLQLVGRISITHRRSVRGARR